MEQEELLKKRIQELARMADRKGLVTFTDFLNLNEQNILHQTLQKFSWIHGETFGGYEGAERRMAAFLPDVLYDPQWSYPIACVQIRPRSARFAEKLSHRDILCGLTG
jgi:RNA-binding protein YlmH